MKLTNTIIPMLAAVAVTACSSSGTSVDDSSTLDSQAATPTEAVTSEGTPSESGDLLTGRFVDSAVIGLDYTTATQSGETGAEGTFNYLAGEEVTFSIGDIVLPSTDAANLLTPLSLFATDDITDIRVMNLSRLLQTLDTDGDPTNGITISESAEASAQGLTLDFASTSFEDDVVNLVANSGSSNTSLVNGIEALDHLQETLFVEGIDERPAPPAAVAEEAAPVNSNNTATNPLVGRSAEFSNFAHDISGTLTVLDDRTLEISNFNYDGGGVTVFFYTGLDGDFRNGREIGPQLNGRPYNDETIILTLPDDITLDDFNGISVWCVPFFADFGNAQL